MWAREAFGGLWRMRARPPIVAGCELVLLLGVILVLNVAYSGRMFWAAPFDPFLVLVMLISVQHGLGFGLTAAAASALVVLNGDLPPLTFDSDLYAYWTEIARRPALWLAAALVLGSLSSRHIRRSRQLVEAFADADEQRKRIAAAYGEARQANEELLLRLNSNRVTFPAISLALQRLFRKTTGEILEEADELIALALDARTFSIFLIQGTSLNVLRRVGWDEEGKYEDHYDRDSLLFDAVIRERRLLCIANPLDEVFLAHDGVLAAPICDSDTGRVIGMLKVEELDFVRFHAQTIENLRIVAEWLGLALARAERWADPYLPLTHSSPSAGSRAPVNGIQGGAAFPPGLKSPAIEYPFSSLAIRVTWGHGTDVDISAVGEALRRTAVPFVARAPEAVVEGGEFHSEVFFLLLPKFPAASSRLFGDMFQLALKQCLPDAVERPAVEILETSVDDNASNCSLEWLLPAQRASA